MIFDQPQVQKEIQTNTGTNHAQSLDLSQPSQPATVVLFSENKAKFPELFAVPNKKKKGGGNKTKSAFQPLKNPCLALNELKPGLEYKLLDKSGPVHAPIFKIAIELNEKTFTGEGR